MIYTNLKMSVQHTTRQRVGGGAVNETDEADQLSNKLVWFLRHWEVK